jgi:UDP-N-acetyl-D-mannosaminuronate dehydrogenase
MIDLGYVGLPTALEVAMKVRVTGFGIKDICKDIIAYWSL